MRLLILLGAGIALCGACFATPAIAQEAAGTTLAAPVQARVLAVSETDEAGESKSVYKVRLLTGDTAGTDVTIGDNEEFSVLGYTTYATGDRVLVSVIDHIDGSKRYLITDFERRTQLAWLVAVFILGVIWLTRWRGVGSLAGLAFSYAVIILWIVPMISRGSPPVLITLAGSAAILSVSFVVTEGFTRRTAIAAAGTILTMVVVGVFGDWAINFANLTGASSEEAFFLQGQGAGSIDIRGLLLAGIIIGTLGILDDIAISQVAVVAELRRVNPQQTPKELYAAALRVGRSHLTAIVNTLLLAYTGSALPLLVLFNIGGNPAGLVVNGEIVATEIARSVIGSLGIMLALPITTALAAWFGGRETGKLHHHHHAHG